MLIDQFRRPLQDLRISVIDNCNFRCTYCMPAEIFGEDYAFLKKDELLSFEEIEQLVRVFAAYGVRKIKITGGEPLLRPWLPELISRLKHVPGITDLALITNGYHLAKMARRLKDAGLDRVTVSLDSLQQEVFGQMNGRGYSVGRVLEGIEASERAGFGGVKINMVVQRGINDQEVVDVVRHFKVTPHTVRFIEYMDVGNRNRWEHAHMVPSRELRDRIHSEFPLVPVDPAYRGEVADRYRFLDGSGEVGFISSVTQPFCRDCTRARLSADGKLYTCLFSQTGTDLRALLRDGASTEDISARLESVWGGRHDRYSEERSKNGSVSGEKVEMYYIGG